MAIFKCKMCGGDLEIYEGSTVAQCIYCGTQQTLPKLDNDRVVNLYDRANHFRRNNDFDKAMGIYEQILNADTTDAEAYWSLVLCHYGIEYVKDPATGKRVPTVNRTQYTSIFDDENYKSALEFADAHQKQIYESEAKVINEIQKGILAISQNEQPFDVFICYKETDIGGRRTPDSVLANDLYHQLTQEGFKVFFSRITLEDKLGTAYEPYIFAALNSSKVMVVLGTQPDYFNAVWVKNEWSRYLTLIKAGADKVLIPAYRDMDPYDLPEEFSHLQAQDMSKLGFMQDLIRGIKKITQAETPQKTVVKETVATASSANISPLLRRASMFLEDSDFRSADEYCEKVLDIEPENATAYMYKMMAELKVKKQSDLKHQREPFDSNKNYQKAIRFGNEQFVNELKSDVKYIKDRNENERISNIYYDACNLMKEHTPEDYLKAAKLFQTISGYKDAGDKAIKCTEKAETTRKYNIYNNAVKLMEENTVEKYRDAAKLFESISGYKDADDKAIECTEKAETTIYNNAVKLMEENTAEQYRDAAKLFESISGYKDADDKAVECKEKAEITLKDNIYDYAVSLMAKDSSYDYVLAKFKFKAISGYKDADALYELCEQKINEFVEAEKAQLEEKERQRKIKEKQDADEAKRIKRIILIVCVVWVSIFVILYLIIGVFVPSAKYKKAAELCKQGEYAEAIKIYTELKNYKDSYQKGKSAKHDYALSLLDDKNYSDAIKLLNLYQLEELKPEFYGCAEKLMKAGDFENAVKIFTVLGNYKQSPAYLESMYIETEYQRAGALLSQSDYKGAYSIYNDISDYKDSAQKLIEIRSAHLELAKTGEIIYYGEYEQDGNTDNGKEKIEWIIVGSDDGNVWGVSLYGLECMSYHDKKEAVSWKDCSLRKWLNGEFYENSFSSAEKEKIMYSYETKFPGANDYVFLLSESALESFESALGDNLEVKATAYADSKQRFEYKDFWWVKDPKKTDEGTFVAGNETYTGYKYRINKALLVRPALSIRIE